MKEARQQDLLRSKTRVKSIEREISVIRKLDPGYLKPKVCMDAQKIPPVELRIASWLKIKNKDILQDRRYNAALQLNKDREKKQFTNKPLNGGVEQHVRIDFNLPHQVKSLHDLKFFRNVDADVTKQLAELDHARKLRYSDKIYASM